MNPVSSLDWSPKTNLLLSASTDRGVIVWNDTAKGMKPQLSIIKESKSNIDAAWNHNGNKFCVGASSGNVFIGKFDDAMNFWVAPSISKVNIAIIFAHRWKEAPSQRFSGQRSPRPSEWPCLRFGLSGWKMLCYIMLHTRDRY